MCTSDVVLLPWVVLLDDSLLFRTYYSGNAVVRQATIVPGSYCS